MALTEWEAVEYLLGVIDEVRELERLDHETCRFVFYAKDPAATRPVPMLLSGTLGGGAIIALAQVSGDHLNEAVAAAEHVPLAGLSTVGGATWFLKSGTFKSVMDAPSLRNHIFVVALAHNHYSSLISQNQS